MSYTVLMIAPTSFFADYGCHVRIWEEAKILKQLGHRVVMTTYHNGDDMPGLDIRRSWDVPWIKRVMVGSSRHQLYLDMALLWRTISTAPAVAPGGAGMGPGANGSWLARHAASCILTWRCSGEPSAPRWSLSRILSTPTS